MLPKLDFQSTAGKRWLAPTCRGKRCLFLQVLQQTAAALLLCNTWSLSRGSAGREEWEAVPGMLPGQPAVLHCQVAAEPCSWHSRLRMLLPSPSPQEQNQGGFCDTFFYFMVFSNGYPMAGENSSLVFRFCAKIPQIL